MAMRTDPALVRTGRRVLLVEPSGYAAEARQVLSACAAIDEGPLNRAELIARIGGYDAAVIRFAHRFDAELIEAGRNLRAIACAATGIDHIDEAAAAAAGIRIISLRGETRFLRRISASAEFGWGLLLALMRRIPAAVAQVRSGGWDRDALRGRDLAGKRLALIGCGRIGEKSARYARAFGMRVSAYDPHRRTLPPGVTHRRTLALALADADVVMIHAALTPQTRGMMDRDAFAAMKPGAVLVNTARGAILDEAALLAALESGRLAGAALDVLADESQASGNALVEWGRSHERLLITPHLAGASIDAMAETELFIARRLAALLRGRHSRAPHRAAAVPMSVR
jgi:D-3-phosphoglycerate dehydrogenase